MGQLSYRELSVLEIIRSYHKDHGYAPSIRELCKKTGIKSTSLISWYIEKLVSAGRLKKDPAIARGIVVVEDA